jgi:hypothetical protein
MSFQNATSQMKMQNVLRMDQGQTGHCSMDLTELTTAEGLCGGGDWPCICKDPEFSEIRECLSTADEMSARFSCTPEFEQYVEEFEALTAVVTHVAILCHIP